MRDDVGCAAEQLHKVFKRIHTAPEAETAAKNDLGSWPCRAKHPAMALPRNYHTSMRAVYEIPIQSYI